MNISLIYALVGSRKDSIFEMVIRLALQGHLYIRLSVKPTKPNFKYENLTVKVLSYSC